MKELYQLNNLSNLSNEITRPLNKTQRIKYTCYDASRNYVACGATSGSIYLFQRQPCKFLQLIPNTFGSISNVAISQQEHYVAYSSQKGTILVYVIDSENDAQPTILSTYYREMKITQLHWRKNESQLFVGDLTGNVFLVNLNNFLGRNLANISIHPILFLESPVVQICDFEQLVLVSNYTKCILCNTETEEFKQIGNQPRDGKFGACFVTPMDSDDGECDELDTVNPVATRATTANAHATRIFCARPGARMWECDLNGVVIQTHKFKVALKTCRYANILNPSTTSSRTPNSAMIDQLVHLQPIQKRFILGHTVDAFFVFDVRKSTAILWNDEFGAIHTIKVVDDTIDECTIVVFTKDNRTFTFQMQRLDRLFGDLVMNRGLYDKATQILLEHLSYFQRKIDDTQFAFSYTMLRTKLEAQMIDSTLLDELQSIDSLLSAKAIQKQLNDCRPVRMKSGIYMIRDKATVPSNTMAEYHAADDTDTEADDNVNEPLVITSRKPTQQQITPTHLSDDEKVLQNLFLIYKSLKWSNLNLVERYADEFDRYDVPGIAKILKKLEAVILENDAGVSEMEAKRNCARMFLSYFSEATLFELDQNSFDFVVDSFILVNASAHGDDENSARCVHCKFPLVMNVPLMSLKYKTLCEKIVESFWMNEQKERIAQIVKAVPGVLFITLKMLLVEKFELNATTATASLNSHDKNAIADIVFACGDKRQLEYCVEKYGWFRGTEFWNKFIERLIRLRSQQMQNCLHCQHEQHVRLPEFVTAKHFYTYDYVFNVCADYLNGLTALQLCMKYSRHIPCDALGKSFYLKCLMHS